MATESIKNILDTEVPRPSFVLRPSVAAPIPSEVTHTRNGQDDVARTLDPYSGKFESVAEDTPRVYGDSQSLFMEASSRKNHVLYSSAINQSNWGGTDLGAESAVSSVIKGQTAYEQAGDSSNNFANIQNGSGTLTGNAEVAHFIIEKGTAAESAVGVYNTTSGTHVFGLDYDWSADSTTVSLGAVSDSYVRTLQSVGPNGGKVVEIVVRYAGSNGGNVNGESREARVYVDRTANSNTTICHHAQIEQAPNPSSPIVTGSTGKTRAADSYTIFSGGEPDWWNSNQGTLLFDLSIQFRSVDTPESSMRVCKFGSVDEIRVDNGFKGKQFYRLTSSTNRIFDVNPFKVDNIAVSFDGATHILAVNGSSKSASAKSNIAGTDSLSLGGKQRLLATFRSITYIPRALPESTLNTLTS